MQAAARLGTTQPSFRIAAETLSELLRVGISDTTVWRHHREVTSEIEEQRRREEQEVPLWVMWADMDKMDWIAVQEPVEDHASISIDGSTILIRDEGYREVKTVVVSEVTRGPDQESGSPRAGETREGEAVRTETKPGRQRDLKLVRHSYRAVLGDKAAFAPALKVELARRRVREVEKITAVNDGAEWIWDLVRSFLPERCVEVLDWPHAMQNLAKAAHAAWGEGTEEARAWLAERETELWKGQVIQVDIALHQLPRRYKERGKAIRQVKEYISQHWNRLRYNSFRAEGRPIGSGAVESAAKNVVAWRMKRGGQRWSRSGATRMLAALGEFHSGRWKPATQRLAKAA